MSEKYFTRTIAEGTVKRKHVCSFDKSIELTFLASPCRKVLNNMFKMTAQATKDMINESKDDTKSLIDAKENFKERLASTRFNGLPMVIEDFETSFDEDEYIEVVAFINGADMKDFGGDAKEESKNAKSRSKI